MSGYPLTVRMNGYDPLHTHASPPRPLPCPPTFQDLDMEALYLCSDALLGRLAAAAPRLDRLCIRMCHRLSAAAIVDLVRATRMSALLVSRTGWGWWWGGGGEGGLGL